MDGSSSNTDVELSLDGHSHSSRANKADEPLAGGSGGFISHAIASLESNRRIVRFMLLILSLLSCFLLASTIYFYVNYKPGAGKDSTVALTTSNIPPNGYTYGGSLFAGTGNWVKKNNMPDSLSDHVAITVGNQIFFFGGQNTSGTVASVYVFHAILESWTVLPPMPSGPRMRHAVASANGKIFIIGGLKVVNGVEVLIATVDVFNVATRTFLPNAAANLPANQLRVDLAAAGTARGTIIIAGGYDSTYNGYSNVLEFSPSTNTWTVKGASMTEARGDLAAVAVGNKVYICGGWTPSNWLPSKTLEVYDLETDKMTRLADMFTARGDGGFVYMSDQQSLLMIGGEINLDATTQIPVHNSEEYHIDLNAWTRRAPSLVSRFRFAYAYGVGSNAAAFIFGGTDVAGKLQSSVDAYYSIGHPTVYYHMSK